MTLMRTERDTMDGYLPGLDKYLSEIPLLELEKPGHGALAKFRELGGPALLVPAEYEGKGACLLDAVRIQRAVGSRSPSLAVATTMHHFSVASLVELTTAGNGFEWAMLAGPRPWRWYMKLPRRDLFPYIGEWAQVTDVEIAYTSANSSWLNRIPRNRPAERWGTFGRAKSSASA